MGVTVVKAGIGDLRFRIISSCLAGHPSIVRSAGKASVRVAHSTHKEACIVSHLGEGAFLELNYVLPASFWDVKALTLGINIQSLGLKTIALYPFMESDAYTLIKPYIISENKIKTVSET